MTQRDFWWQYHFVCGEFYATVDILKALFAVIVKHDGIEHEYVRSVRSAATKKEDSRFEVAWAMLNNVQSFQHERLLDLFR